MKLKLESTLPGEITTSDMQMIPPFGRKQNGTKKHLMKVKEESGKVGLKLNIPETKIMTPSVFTSWHIGEEKMGTVKDITFLGSNIIAEGDWSHESKRCLFLGRKVMTNLGSILKSRDFTLSTKVHLVKAVVFPVVLYGCESWTTKKAEHWRIDAFELWYWRRLLRRIPLNCEEIKPVKS